MKQDDEHNRPGGLVGIFSPIQMSRIRGSVVNHSTINMVLVNDAVEYLQHGTLGVCSTVDFD
jgi:hypothetical protein